MPSPPSVTEGFNLFLARGDVVEFAVLHFSAGGAPLEIGVERDAVRRVHVMHWTLRAGLRARRGWPWTLERCRPGIMCVGSKLGVVLVETGGAASLGRPLKSAKQVDLGHGGLRAGLRLPEEIVDETLGMNFFLDVERGRRERRGRTNRRRLCRARQLGIGWSRLRRRRRPGRAICPPRHMRDWYSPVGRFLRLSSWRRVATVFGFRGLGVGFGLAGIKKRSTAINANGREFGMDSLLETETG